ncbi:serine protease, partial [Rhizobium leguminosarum]
LSFAPLVKQTSGAVVNVYAEKTFRRQSPFAGDPFFEQFFGQQMPNRSEKQSSLGSGAIDDVIVGHDSAVRLDDDAGA